MAHDPRSDATRPNDAPFADPALDVDPASRRMVEQYGRAFVQGDVLFREGEPATDAFLLQRGRVRLLRRVRMVERSVSVLRPGDLFGEGALVDPAPGSAPGASSLRTSTAVAVSDGVALAFDRAALRTLLERVPSLTERILSQLVRRLREAEDQIEVLMLRDTQSKVVSTLLKLSRGSPGPVELTLSPVDLSTRVGLDVETVKRAVQKLRDQQYVRIIGERIEIPDVDALRRLYGLLGTKEELRGR